MVDIYRLIFIFSFLKFSWTYPQINQAVFLNPLTNSTFVRCPLDLTPSLDIQWYDEFNRNNNRFNLGRFYRIENLEPSQRILICSSRVSFNDKFYLNIRIYDRPLPIPYFIVTKFTNTSLSVFWQDDIYNKNANITSYELILKYSHVIQTKIRVNRTNFQYTFIELNPNTNYSIEISVIDIWNRLSLPKIIKTQTLPIDINAKFYSNQILDSNQIDQTIDCYNFNWNYLFINFNSSTIHRINHIYNLTIFNRYEKILFTTNLYSSFVYSIGNVNEKYKIQLSISTFQLEYLGEITKSCEIIRPMCSLRKLNLKRFYLNIHMQSKEFIRNMQSIEIFYRKNSTNFVKRNFQQINSITDEILLNENNYSVIMDIYYLNEKFDMSILCSIIQIATKSISRFTLNHQIVYAIIISIGILIISFLVFQSLKSARTVKSTSIPVEQFRLHVLYMHRKQNYAFKRLFEKIYERSKNLVMNTNSYIVVREAMMERRNEFWRMIWDDDVRIIIMFDDNQIGSDIYWPEEYIEMYGNIEVTLVDMNSFAFYTQRVFSVRCITNENLIPSEHLVYHFQYFTWPPTLRTFIHHLDNQITTPRVIHCCQSEIYIIIDLVLKKINQSKSIDIPSIIKQNQLVLTFEQFVLVYDLLDEFIEQMNISSSSIEQQFYSIVANRKQTNGVSIDPTYLHGYYRIDQYVILKHPLKDQRNNFWRMIWNTQSEIILALYTTENLYSNVYDYWPLENEIVHCEDFTVKLIDEYLESEYVHRNCLIQSTKNDDELHVKILACSYWPDSCSSIESSFHLVNTIKMLNPQKPIFVHDQFGGYRSGLFCALYTMKEQFDNERLFDLYELAKLYDLKRPGIWHDSTDLLFLRNCEDFLRREYDEKCLTSDIFLSN